MFARSYNCLFIWFAFLMFCFLKGFTQKKKESYSTCAKQKEEVEELERRIYISWCSRDINCFGPLQEGACSLNYFGFKVFAFLMNSTLGYGLTIHVITLYFGISWIFLIYSLLKVVFFFFSFSILLLWWAQSSANM